MVTVIPMSQARRRLKRIVALVAKGHVFVVTKNGKPCVMIEVAEKQKLGHSDAPKSNK